MRIALVPGSFDPITLGHVNIIERAAKMFDKVVVAVMINDSAKYHEGLSSKQYTFSMDERLTLVRLSVGHIENVEAIAREGLLIDLFDSIGATAIVKGIRNSADLEYEMIHAKWNKEHNERAETLFLPADESFNSVSSTMVRQMLESENFDELSGVLAPAAIDYLKKLKK